MNPPKYDPNQQSWIIEVQHDGEDHYIQLTDEILEVTGWKIGDTLLWERAEGSAWTLRKKP